MSETADGKGGTTGAPVSGEQVSDILLKFAEPLLDTAPEGVAVEQIQRVLNLAATVWDAVVADDAIGLDAEISLARVLDDMNQQAPAMVPLLQNLARRKRRLFPDAAFLVGGIEVEPAEGGGFTIRARSKPV